MTDAVAKRTQLELSAFDHLVATGRADPDPPAQPTQHWVNVATETLAKFKEIWGQTLHKPGPTPPPVECKSRAGGYGTLPPPGARLQWVANNPKREGTKSARRWNEYSQATTYQEYVQLNPLLAQADWHNDYKKGYVKVVGTPTVPSHLHAPPRRPPQTTTTRRSRTSNLPPSMLMALPEPSVPVAPAARTNRSAFPAPNFKQFTLANKDRMCEQGAMSLLLHRLTPGSQHTYKYSLRRWCLWRRIRGKPVLLSEDNDAEETDMMEFVYYFGVVLGYAHSTLKVTLFALRYAHILGSTSGRDIIKDKLRLKLTLLGLKRLQSSPIRKYAVSVQMLKAVIAEQRGPTWDQIMLALAISMAFFFLLRASEYISKDGKVHAEKILLADDLSICKKGVLLPWDQVNQADELLIHLRGSKADIFNEGNKLNLTLTPGAAEPPEHPLVLLRLAYAMKPAAFQGAHPFFTKDDNKTVISRAEVNKALKSAALKLGLDPDDHTTHSLRAGGATALWRAGWSPPKIKRRGRWLSDCWLTYIWPGREEADGIVEDILALK